MSLRVRDIGGLRFGNDAPLCLIAGPTRLEALDRVLCVGEVLKSVRTARGPRLEAGVEMRARANARPLRPDS